MRRRHSSALWLAMLIAALAQVAPLAAGLIDVTDPDNPSERFFEIRVGFSSRVTAPPPWDLLEERAQIHMDATDPGPPKGTVIAATKADFSDEGQYESNVKMFTPVSATIRTTSSDRAVILMPFNDAQITFRLSDRGRPRSSAGSGRVKITFNPLTGEVLAVAVTWHTPEWNSFAAFGVPAPGARLIEH